VGLVLLADALAGVDFDLRIGHQRHYDALLRASGQRRGEHGPAPRVRSSM
jgi:hypothetical protein